MVKPGIACLDVTHLIPEKIQKYIVFNVQNFKNNQSDLFAHLMQKNATLLYEM